MHRIVEVKPLENYKLWISFSDEVEGVVDLSHLVGSGIFSAWNDIRFFNSVFIDQESHTVAWNGGIDLCPDALYAGIVGLDPLKLLKKESITGY